jgi:hypothetical protein
MANRPDPRYSNPDFDKRITALPGMKATSSGTGVDTGSLQRGYIIQDLGYGPTPYTQYSVKFLYNPSVVEVTHQNDPNSSPASLPQNRRDPLTKNETINIPITSSVGFALLFDRTYELWNAGATYSEPYLIGTTTDVSKVGVWADIAAMYRLVGILQQEAVALPNTNPKGNVPVELFPSGSIGPMPMTPCTVYFGGQNALSFHGYINNLSVQYTHFSQLMVPFRCTVQVSMQLTTSNPWTWQ